MPFEKLKIAVISAEVEPFSKSGGLASVACFLTKEFYKLGHKVAVITPFYKTISKDLPIEVFVKDFSFEWQGEKNQCDILKGELCKDTPVYFIRHHEYFSKQKKLYGSSFENSRFAFFNLAALELLKKIHYKADIIQCHDWHTGLVPYFLHKEKNYLKDPFYKNTAALFTIHNLAFQMGNDWWKVPLSQKDKGRESLPPIDSKEMETINFAKRGILYADAINTVSEQYAEEILTKQYGQDLQGILRRKRKRLFGIINGIDFREYNPASDPGLARSYSKDTIENKLYNKWALQQFYNLPRGASTPLLGMVSRLAEQKGIDLLLQILDVLLRQDIQIIIMGDGDKKYINEFKKYSRRYPQKFVYTPFRQKDETGVYAGADILLLPSRFEPCGLNQLIAMRYGCVPVVHATGGLIETVRRFNPKTRKGTGFIFKTYDSRDFLIAIIRAIDNFHYPETWRKIVRQGMEQSFSWELPAQKYILLFKKAIRWHKTEPKNLKPKNFKT